MRYSLYLNAALALALGAGIPKASVAAVDRLVQRVEHGIFSAKVDLNGPIEIGVINPHGDFFVLARNGIYCPGVTYADHRLSIRPSDAIGVAWSEGGATERFVFDRVGRYEIIVSDNLETELENSFSLTYKIDVQRSDLGKSSSEMKAPPGISCSELR